MNKMPLVLSLLLLLIPCITLAQEDPHAEFTAKQVMEHDPAYGGSRLAMALVLQKMGEIERAAEEQAAKDFWGDADPDLPGLQIIQRESNLLARSLKR